MLARSLGVTHLIVAVNKMDVVGWQQSRFETIVGTIEPFLKASGFRSNQVTYLPVSGLNGDNLQRSVSDGHVPGAEWYKGPTLLDAIDTVEVTGREEEELRKPFRFVSGLPRQRGVVAI